jgi:hypothetical protein
MLVMAARVLVLVFLAALGLAACEPQAPPTPDPAKPPKPKVVGD